MQLASIVVLILTGIIIFFQDYKSREISVWVLALFLIFSFINYIRINTWQQVLSNGLFTLIYLGLCGLIVAVYFKLKLRKMSSLILIEKYIGYGDLIIIAGLGLVMEPPLFIYFNTIVFSVSVVMFYIFWKGKTVPLAGNMAFSYVVMHLINLIFDVSLFQLTDV